MEQKMKTTGLKYISAAVLATALFYIFWKRNKNTIEKFSFFSDLENYKPYNSFIEHFDSKNINEAYDKYRKYLEFGMNEDNAFKSVIENKIRKND
jgi:hypothetical protein